MDHGEEWEETMNQFKTTVFAVPLALLGLSAVPMFGDEHDKKTDVTITQEVQVPGGTVLPPGTYMFILNDSASDRNIVEIRSEDGSQLYALTFTTRATRVDRTASTVLTFYEMPAGQPPALRQWFWPGDYDGQEFLYPHGQAAQIDQSTNQKLPEVSDQNYSNMIDRGFSTQYPAGATSSQSSPPIPARSLDPAHVVGDPGVQSQNSQGLPNPQQ
jgi:hypothetical protein